MVSSIRPDMPPPVSDLSKAIGLDPGPPDSPDTLRPRRDVTADDSDPGPPADPMTGAVPQAGQASAPGPEWRPGSGQDPASVCPRPFVRMRRSPAARRAVRLGTRA